MISKFLGKLKSILFKSPVVSETPLKKEKKPTKSAKSSKTKAKTANSKKNIETLLHCLVLELKVQRLCMRQDLKRQKLLSPPMKKIYLLYLGLG